VPQHVLYARPATRQNHTEGITANTSALKCPCRRRRHRRLDRRLHPLETRTDLQPPLQMLASSPQPPAAPAHVHCVGARIITECVCPTNTALQWAWMLSNDNRMHHAMHTRTRVARARQGKPTCSILSALLCRSSRTRASILRMHLPISSRICW
jgi:hypothetical protein